MIYVLLQAQSLHCDSVNYSIELIVLFERTDPFLAID